MNSTSKVHDIHQRDDLAFPTSLRGFQKLFPDDAACAAYLERVRWHGTFECQHGHEKGEPYRFAGRTAGRTQRIGKVAMVPSVTRTLGHDLTRAPVVWPGHCFRQLHPLEERLPRRESRLPAKPRG